MSDDSGSDCCEVMETAKSSTKPAVEYSRTKSVQTTAKPPQSPPPHTSTKGHPDSDSGPDGKSSRPAVSRRENGQSLFGGTGSSPLSVEHDEDGPTFESENMINKSPACRDVAHSNPATGHSRDSSAADEDSNEDGDQGGESEAPNPFASFAFGGSMFTSSAVAGSKRKSRESERLESQEGKSSTIRTTKDRQTHKQTKYNVKDSIGGGGEKKEGAKGGDLASMSAIELQALRAKWRSMADRLANEEDQRFQILVAAVLSRRARTTVVMEGLKRLRDREGSLTASSMEAIEQDELASILRSVHWNKAKSKHIREGAAIILRRHRGKVPRRKGDILALPGVGPALGEILVTVFDEWGADNHAEAAANLKGKDEAQDNAKLCSNDPPDS